MFGARERTWSRLFARPSPHKSLDPGSAVPTGVGTCLRLSSPHASKAVCLLPAHKISQTQFGVFIVPSSHLLPKPMTSHAPRAWWLETKSYARSSPRRPPRGLGGNPTHTFFRFTKFFRRGDSKKEKQKVYVGFRPPSIRAGRGLRTLGRLGRGGLRGNAEPSSLSKTLSKNFAGWRKSTKKRTMKP